VPNSVAIGTTFDTSAGRIDSDAAVAFALATNDPNDIYLNGGTVPPLYTASLIQPAHAHAENAGVPVGSIRGAKATVHADHDVYFRKPARPGMALEWNATIRSLRSTPAGAMFTNQIEIRDSQGSPIMEHLWSTIYVGGEIPADLGPPLPDHGFPEPARSNAMGIHEFDITQDQTYRYGGVSGDRIGHSMDDEIARSEGFPGKILQGMCTLSMCSGAVVKLAAGGDPDGLLRLAGRFSAPVRPHQKMTVSVYDGGLTSAGLRLVAFEAAVDDVTVIKHGRAELAID
jgi:hypothetical protein